MSNDVSFTGTLTLNAIRVESLGPVAYRLARRNGEIVLQGRFDWQCGSEYGHEWRDLPTVDLGAEEVPK